MGTSTAQRVQKHRDSLRAAGYRPLQLWVPDTKRPEFIAECHRQSRMVAAADAADTELNALLEESLASVDGWTGEA